MIASKQRNSSCHERADPEPGADLHRVCTCEHLCVRCTDRHSRLPFSEWNQFSASLQHSQQGLSVCWSSCLPSDWGSPGRQGVTLCWAIQNIFGTQLFRTGLLPPLWLHTGKPAFLGRKATAYLCSFTLLKCIYYHCTITVLLLQYGKDSNWKKNFALNPSSAKNTKPKIKIKQNDNNKNHKKKPHQKNQKAERSNNCPELPYLKLAWIIGELLSISFPFLLRKHWNKRKLTHMGVQLPCSSESAQHPLRNNIMAWRSVQARAWNWH